MNANAFKILMVEDEVDFAKGLMNILQMEGYLVTHCESADEAIKRLHQPEHDYDLVLTDLMLKGASGLTLLDHVANKYPNSKVILMTAYASVETAIKALKQGACAYYVKGNDLDELLSEIATLRLQMTHEPSARVVSSVNPAFIRAMEMAIKAAKAPVNILLLGESGVGKEVFARLIHDNSPRSHAPFVAVNCQALSESVLESELFGHKKGAYTGAHDDRIGRFEAANQGTLFLDEIADLPLSIQIKLLRVIETRSIERLGCNINRPVDFRLVTATNKPIDKMIASGHFREDFYYRINTVEIHIPPLRERKEDIRKLAMHFVEKAAIKMGKPIKSVDESVWQHLLSYDFPGNVRELKNIMERLVVFSDDGIINEQHLFIKTDASQPFGEDLTLKSFRSALERQYIVSILKKNQSNVTQTAEVLGITRRQLQNKMKDYDIIK